jgi:hypothetical protein
VRGVYPSGLNRVFKYIRSTAAAYVFLVALACFAVVYQVRSSWDTVRVETRLEYYIPFQIAPFSDRIDDRAHFMSWEAGSEFNPGSYSVLRSRNELLKVNGRPFRGMSDYLAELWRYERQATAPHFNFRPFTVTVRSDGTRVHDVEIGFPHCTCGVPPFYEAVAMWMALPLLCVCLGFAVAFPRPHSLLAWSFLCLMLSASQFRAWPETYTGFQLTVTPMIWTDWLRIPAVAYRAFVQSIWPAGLLLGAVALCRRERRTRPVLLVVAAAFCAIAVLQAALAVSWSEDYRRLEPLYRVLQSHSLEAMLLAFAAVLVAAFFVDHRLGVAGIAIAGLATLTLFSSPSRITEGNWYTFSDSSWRFVATIPNFHWNRTFVEFLFSVGFLLSLIVFIGSRFRSYELAACILSIPLLLHTGGSLGGYWGWYWLPYIDRLWASWPRVAAYWP